MKVGVPRELNSGLALASIEKKRTSARRPVNCESAAAALSQGGQPCRETCKKTTPGLASSASSLSLVISAAAAKEGRQRAAATMAFFISQWYSHRRRTGWDQWSQKR